jgi:hypothetical protein
VPNKGTVPLPINTSEAGHITGWLETLLALKRRQPDSVDPELERVAAWFKKVAIRAGRPRDAFTVNVERHWAVWLSMLADFPRGFTVNEVELPADQAVLAVADRCRGLVSRRRGRRSSTLEQIAAVAIGDVNRDNGEVAVRGEVEGTQRGERQNRRMRAELTEERLLRDGRTVLGSIELYHAVDKIRRN